jgi:pilus assembly protein CpaB
MARRFVIALLVALGISSAAVLLIYQKMAANKPVVQVPFQYVAVAHAVDPGDILKREDLTLINWPRSNPLTGSFGSVDNVVGRVVLYPLAANQPVLDQELASGSGLGVTGRIPTGMRAIALRSDEVIGVAGFLMPATHVDVLVTYRPVPTADPITATVLQDAEILAVGHELQPDPAGKPQNVDVVTLLLTPQDAEKAVLAAAQGSIHFILRSGKDNAAAQTIPVALPELASLPATKKGAGIPVHKQEPAKPKPWVVETQMGGGKRSTDSFSY